MVVDIETLARQLATELSDEFPNLPRDLEIAIAEMRTRGPEKHLSFTLSDAVPLASLLLTALKIGWDIWRDIASSDDPPAGPDDPPPAGVADLKVTLSKELETTIEAHNIDAKSASKILDIVAKRIASDS